MAIPASLANQLSIPVIGSPLFIISNPKLVVAQCTAGIVGAFPSLNARPAEQLDGWLAEITAALAGRSDVTAVHVIAHGSAGSTQLGTSTLNEDALLQRAGEIAGWGRALSTDADLGIGGWSGWAPTARPHSKN